MLVERFVCGRARSNAYVFAPGGGPQALIVDAGAGAGRRIMDMVSSEGLEPQALVLTHGHPDHIWTARQIADTYEIPVYVHRSDERWLSDPATGGQLFGARLVGGALSRARRMRPKRVQTVTDGDVIQAGDLSLEVMHTPGHSRGSVCLRTSGTCFAGDTVFAGSVGRVIFPGGNAIALRESIRSKLLGLPDDVRLFPGHGDKTTVGGERERWKVFLGDA